VDPWLVPPAGPAPELARWVVHADQEGWRVLGPWDPPRWPTGPADRTPGSAGDNERLGWHPDGSREALEHAEALEWYLGAVRWVESRRPVWWEDMPHDGSAYLFGQQGHGLHRNSRVTWGHAYTPWGWNPPLGERNGWGGWNLEHLVSLLPLTAMISGDEWCLRRSEELAWICANMLSPAGLGNSYQPYEPGGYFGGNVETHSPRGYLRPLRTMAHCAKALRCHGMSAQADEIDGAIAHRLRRVVTRSRPLGYGNVSSRPDSWVPGHEGEATTPVWQAGLAAWLHYYGPGLPTPQGRDDAATLVKDFQRMLVQSWTSHTGIPHDVLAVDWTLGNYASRLDHWSWALVQIPGLAGVDQSKRAQVQADIAQRYPEVAAGRTKWSAGA